MNNYGERSCVVCGKKFMPVYAAQVACSKVCQKVRENQRKANYRASLKLCMERIDALEQRVNKLESDDGVREEECNDDSEEAPALPEERKGRGREEENEEAEEVAEDAVGDYEDESEYYLDKREIPPELRDITSIAEALVKNGDMKYCERMRLKAFRLPCGKREECYRPDRCAQVPPGKTEADVIVPPADFISKAPRGRPRKNRM